MEPVKKLFLYFAVSGGGMYEPPRLSEHEIEISADDPKSIAQCLFDKRFESGRFFQTHGRWVVTWRGPDEKEYTLQSEPVEKKFADSDAIREALNALWHADYHRRHPAA